VVDDVEELAATADREALDSRHPQLLERRLGAAAV
jgi:hypothetical protein